MMLPLIINLINIYTHHLEASPELIILLIHVIFSYCKSCGQDHCKETLEQLQYLLMLL